MYRFFFQPSFAQSRFFSSKMRHELTYYWIEFLKTYRKIDVAECDAFAENSILKPEMSCCTKPDIDLTERKIAAGDSDRVNWVAMSFNKVGTTMFALEDNRAPQCNARIARTVGRRDRRRGHRNKIHFHHFPTAIGIQCCQDCKTRITRILLRALIVKSIRERCQCLIKIEITNR